MQAGINNLVLRKYVVGMVKRAKAMQSDFNLVIQALIWFPLSTLF